MAQDITVMDSRGSASPLGHALVLMGDMWTVRIVRSIFIGRRRFQDIRDALEISDPVLSRRLQSLVVDGILERQAYQIHPPRFEYRLTEAGKDLWRVMIALWNWDRTWADAKSRDNDIELQHLNCGNVSRPVFGCGHCGAIGIGARDVRGSVDDRLLVDVTNRRGRRSPAMSSPIDSSGVLGDRWSTMILSTALMGTHHFSEFQNLLQISPVTLTDRLALFVESGMMSRESVTEGAKRQVYRLTPKGIDFFCVTAMINGWARAWLSEDGQSGLSLRHVSCGHELEPRFTCNTCNEPLARQDVVFKGENLAGVSSP